MPTVIAVSAFTPMKKPNIWDMKLNAIIHAPPNAELTTNFKIILNGFEKITINMHPSIIAII